jgi:hypothetical protein
MATFAATLTLASADAFPHQPINLTASSTLTIAAPYTDLSKVQAVSSGGVELLTTADNTTTPTYMFIRHTGKKLNGTDSAGTDKVTIKLTNTASTPVVLTALSLSPLEFLFMPVIGAHSVNCIGIGDPMIEYIFFAKNVL